MQGAVVSVRRKVRPGSMREETRLQLVEGKGIEGDVYFGEELRQILLLDKSTLEEFGYAPGALREQILVDLSGLQALPVGATLQIGDARLEITMDCAPCHHMAKCLGEEGGQFVVKMMGRRGMLAKVLTSGAVEPGDLVLVEVPAGT